MEAFAKFALASHGRIGILRSSRNSSRPGSVPVIPPADALVQQVAGL